jgi:hypothetical protein
LFSYLSFAECNTKQVYQIQKFEKKCKCAKRKIRKVIFYLNSAHFVVVNQELREEFEEDPKEKVLKSEVDLLSVLLKDNTVGGNEDEEEEVKALTTVLLLLKS